ncbi:MAG: histidine phosphatase family protein [Lachnospiraceae bacterium]
MEIYIMRHGQTDWNVLRRLQGGSNTSLNEEGRRLARVTSEALRDIPFTRAYTSPLWRAKETAQIILRDRKIPLIEEPRLREISFGIYEGLTCQWDQSEIPDPEFMNFFYAPEKYHAPQGGESLESLCARTTEFLNELVQNADLQDDTILLSSHGAAVRALLSSVNKEGSDMHDFWHGVVHRNCAVTHLHAENGIIQLLEEGKVYY